MENVLLVILLILALALIAIVLMQRSEGGGLGIGGGGGGGVMSARGAATALGKLTWVIGIAFLATSLAMTIVSARNTAGSSVIDRVGEQPATETVPATPAIPDATDTTGTTTPSSESTAPGDAPLAPPRAN
jgi:preprotein translocase subunit SecG